MSNPTKNLAPEQVSKLDLIEASQANSKGANGVSTVNGKTRKTRKPPVLHRSEREHSVDDVMHFEIFDAVHDEVRAGSRRTDDQLVACLKDEINSAQITRRDLYAFIGDAESGGLFENANQAYNLEYGLRSRATISLDCAARWLAVLGKELIFEFRPIEE